MTEKSFYWNNLAVGDASLAPYSANLYHSLWKKMFSRQDNEGIIDSYLNELLVTGVSGGVSVASGGAIVAGTFYTSDDAESVALPSPVTNPRIDRIVLQKIWLSQTVRIARVAGTEGASPSAPSLIQTDGAKWEVPLAQALITTAGVITVTNESELALTALAALGAMVKIEEIVSDGTLATMDFESIPQIYKHLLLVGQVLTSEEGAAGTAQVQLNGDTVAANYSREVLTRVVGSLQSQGNTSLILSLRTRSTTQLSSLFSTQFDILFPNYSNAVFYKNMIINENNIMNNTIGDFSLGTEAGIWLNTDAINRITLPASTGAVFENDSAITLYGIR